MAKGGYPIELLTSLQKLPLPKDAKQHLTKEETRLLSHANQSEFLRMTLNNPDFPTEYFMHEREELAKLLVKLLESTTYLSELRYVHEKQKVVLINNISNRYDNMEYADLSLLKEDYQQLMQIINDQIIYYGKCELLFTKVFDPVLEALQRMNEWDPGVGDHELWNKLRDDPKAQEQMVRDLQSKQYETDLRSFMETLPLLKNLGDFARAAIINDYLNLINEKEQNLSKYLVANNLGEPLQQYVRKYKLSISIHKGEELIDYFDAYIEHSMSKSPLFSIHRKHDFIQEHKAYALGIQTLRNFLKVHYVGISRQMRTVLTQQRSLVQRESLSTTDVLIFVKEIRSKDFLGFEQEVQTHFKNEKAAVRQNIDGMYDVIAKHIKKIQGPIGLRSSPYLKANLELTLEQNVKEFKDNVVPFALTSLVLSVAAWFDYYPAYLIPVYGYFFGVKFIASMRKPLKEGAAGELGGIPHMLNALNTKW